MTNIAHETLEDVQADLVRLIGWGTLEAYTCGRVERDELVDADTRDFSKGERVAHERWVALLAAVLHKVHAACADSPFA